MPSSLQRASTFSWASFTARPATSAAFFHTSSSSKL
jgi:hypothetical protein